MWDTGPQIPRAPNRKKFDEEMEQLSASISTIESAQKKLNLRSDEYLQADLRGLRAEKEASFALLKKANLELKNLSSLVTKKVGVQTHCFWLNN